MKTAKTKIHEIINIPLTEVWNRVLNRRMEQMVCLSPNCIVSDIVHTIRAPQGSSSSSLSSSTYDRLVLLANEFVNEQEQKEVGGRKVEIDLAMRSFLEDMYKCSNDEDLGADFRLYAVDVIEKVFRMVDEIVEGNVERNGGAVMKLARQEEKEKEATVVEKGIGNGVKKKNVEKKSSEETFVNTKINSIDREKQDGNDLTNDRGIQVVHNVVPMGNTLDDHANSPDGNDNLDTEKDKFSTTEKRALNHGLDEHRFDENTGAINKVDDETSNTYTPEMSKDKSSTAITYDEIETRMRSKKRSLNDEESGEQIQNHASTNATSSIQISGISTLQTAKKSSNLGINKSAIIAGDGSNGFKSCTSSKGEDSVEVSLIDNKSRAFSIEGSQEQIQNRMNKNMSTNTASSDETSHISSLQTQAEKFSSNTSEKIDDLIKHEIRIHNNKDRDSTNESLPEGKEKRSSKKDNVIQDSSIDHKSRAVASEVIREEMQNQTSKNMCANSEAGGGTSNMSTSQTPINLPSKRTPRESPVRNSVQVSLDKHVVSAIDAYRKKFHSSPISTGESWSAMLKRLKSIGIYYSRMSVKRNMELGLVPFHDYLWYLPNCDSSEKFSYGVHYFDEVGLRKFAATHFGWDGVKPNSLDKEISNTRQGPKISYVSTMEDPIHNTSVKSGNTSAEAGPIEKNSIHSSPLSRNSDKVLDNTTKAKQLEANHNTKQSVGFSSLRFSKPYKVVLPSSKIVSTYCHADNSSSLTPRSSCTVKYNNLDTLVQISEKENFDERLKRWDPFWKCLLDLTPRATFLSSENNVVASPCQLAKVIECIGLGSGNAPKTALSFSFQMLPSVCQSLGLGTPTKEEKRPKYIYKDGQKRVLLRMLPKTIPMPKKGYPSKADCHTWPKGTVVQLNGRPIGSTYIQQRKQQNHDLSLWKGMSALLDLTPHIYSFTKRNSLDIVSYDNDTYLFQVIVAEYRSPGTIFKLLASGEVPVALADLTLTRKSQNESVRATKNYLMEQTVCIDDDENQSIENSLTIKVRCPITMTLMKVPVRGRKCKHIQCFDLLHFLESNAFPSGRRWKCVCCDSLIDANDLEWCGMLDSMITRAKKNVGVTRDVIFRSDGTWSFKANSDKEAKKAERKSAEMPSIKSTKKRKVDEIIICDD